MKGEPRQSDIFHGKHSQTSEEKCAITASQFGWHIQLSKTWINSASNISNCKMKSEAPERELVVAV